MGSATTRRTRPIIALSPLIALSALIAAPAHAEVPYSAQLSALAQRYYRQCRAEKLMLDQFARDLNEKRLPNPPYRSFREDLAPADRRDAELVCLGAVLQQFDDMQEQYERARAPGQPQSKEGGAVRGTQIQ